MKEKSWVKAPRCPFPAHTTLWTIWWFTVGAEFIEDTVGAITRA